jgi:tRNA-intron endonuclease
MCPFHVIQTNKFFHVPILSEADSLFSEGYGIKHKTRLILNFSETLYLLENKKIIVIDEKTRTNFDFKELFTRFTIDDALFWKKYLVYRDLRSRGFIVREMVNKENTFEVWERGLFNKKDSSYFVEIIVEGLSESISILINNLELSKENDKILKLAVIDQRGEIVYYGLKQANF